MDKDMGTGIVLMGVGGWIIWQAQSFPTLAGMTHGPGLFPSIAGGGMLVCGMLILVTGLRQRALTAAPDAAADPPTPKALRNAFAVLLAVVWFGLGLNWLGYFLVAFPMLFGLMLLFGLRLPTALALAASVTLLVHVLFYSFLHVPLPWGLLEPVAW